LAASLGLLATPGLLWPDQSLPAASTPAPGPHTRRGGPACADRSSRRLARLLWGLFNHGLGGAFANRSPDPFPSRPFKPRGLRTSHEPRCVTTAFAVADTTRRLAMVCCNPWSFRRIRTPWWSWLTSGLPKTVVPPRHRRELSKAWARSRFPWLSPIPAPSHCSSRTPRLSLGSRHLVFDSRRVSRRQAMVCLRPLSLWSGQSLPAASTPAPGPHTSRIELDLSSISAKRRPYPDRSGAFSVTGRAGLGNRRERLDLRQLRFSLTASWTYRTSLSTLLLADVARLASLWYVRNPWPFRLTQSPLGAILLPQAPTSVGLPRHRGTFR